MENDIEIAKKNVAYDNWVLFNKKREDKNVKKDIKYYNIYRKNNFYTRFTQYLSTHVGDKHMC